MINLHQNKNSLLNGVKKKITSDSSSDSAAAACKSAKAVSTLKFPEWFPVIKITWCQCLMNMSMCKS